MIAEGTDSKAVSAEQVTTVAADVEAFRRAHKIKVTEIARTMGYSGGVISEFLGGKYNGDNGQVAKDLEDWLIEEEARRARPKTTQFVWTNVALQMKAVASYCLEFKKIGLLYGHDSSGAGKTTALQAIYQDMGPRRSSLATIDKVDANPTGLLKKLCQAMRLNDNGSNKIRFDRLREKLSGRSHLLIIDQVHNLRGSKDDKPLYILADLYDATGSAQLWVGTADMVAYLRRQQRKHSDESLAQLCRRVFPRVDLMEGIRNGRSGGEPLVSIDQIREMFAKNKLKLTAAAARFLCELANQPDSGSVGLCVQIVEYATAMGSRVTSIDVPQLKEALARGLTTDTAELLLHDLDEMPQRLVKTA